MMRRSWKFDSDNNFHLFLELLESLDMDYMVFANEVSVVSYDFFNIEAEANELGTEVF